MSRVTLSASAVFLLLLAACGGGSSSGDSPTLDEQIDNELTDGDGRLDGEVITTPDGTRFAVDAIDPEAPGQAGGYLLVARLDSRGNPVEIVQSTAIGDAYRRNGATGEFSYSGNNVSYLSADGAGFKRFEGTSSLSLDFDDDKDNGLLRSTFRTSDRATTAVIDAPLDFDPSDGQFSSDGGRLEYTDADGPPQTFDWGVAGGVNGRNAGFSATHGSATGAADLVGRGVMAGERR